jgi:Fe-S-cluster containining protein
VDNKIAGIRGNDPCPCGSGKPYMDCCVSKGHRYALLEYGDQRVIFDSDEADDKVTDVLNYCFNNIIILYNKGGITIDTEKAMKHLRVIYELLDRIFQLFLRHSPCKKGCSECCDQLTWATAIEAEMIHRHIEEKFDHENRLNILSRIHETTRRDPGPIAFGKRFQDDVLSKFLESHNPCPFLSKEGSCVIYESRPFECRAYIVFSDPHECKFAENVDRYEGAYFPYIYTALECLSALVYQDVKYRKYLPSWFVNEFKLRKT